MAAATIPQLLAGNWVLILIVLVAVVTIAVAIWRARRRRVRRIPLTIDGVRIELQGVHLDDDLIVECNWRLTFLMTNSTKRPAPVPLVSSRAIVQSGRKRYASTLYLERDACELNPDEAMVAWVLCQLPAGGSPERITMDWMHPAQPIALTSRVAA